MKKNTIKNVLCLLCISAMLLVFFTLTRQSNKAQAAVTGEGITGSSLRFRFPTMFAVNGQQLTNWVRIVDESGDFITQTIAQTQQFIWTYHKVQGYSDYDAPNNEPHPDSGYDYCVDYEAQKDKINPTTTWCTGVETKTYYKNKYKTNYYYQSAFKYKAKNPDNASPQVFDMKAQIYYGGKFLEATSRVYVANLGCGYRSNINPSFANLTAGQASEFEVELKDSQGNGPIPIQGKITWDISYYHKFTDTTPECGFDYGFSPANPTKLSITPTYSKSLLYNIDPRASFYFYHYNCESGILDWEGLPSESEAIPIYDN